jgi:deazaflavin-dependent oxidoreductase (nitroreductase family)
VTNGLDGETFWIVTEHGSKAAYVRNIEVNPRVRVKIGRRWIDGTARIAQGENPRQRLDAIAQRRPAARFNTRVVVAMGTELLVVRIDLHH